MIRGTRTTALRGVVLVLGASLALSACSAGGDERTGTAPSPSASGTATATPTAIAGAVSPGQAGKGVTGTARPGTGSGAAGTDVAGSSAELAEFFAAAERADASLRRAATLVNGGVRKDRLTIDPAAVRAVKAAAPGTLAPAIPAGMRPDLKRAVLLTYSDIVSRYWAMRFVPDGGDARHPVVIERDRELSPTYAELLEALGNGAPAANRFAGDLAAAKALARRSSLLPDAGPRSRAAAELSVRVADIDGANGCCVSTGGVVFTKLADVRWTGGTSGRTWTGTVDGLGFHVDWKHGTWDAQLAAG